MEFFMADPIVDIDKYLDSLTIEELRYFARVGIGVTCDSLSFAIRSLMKICTNDKKDSLG